MTFGLANQPRDETTRHTLVVALLISLGVHAVLYGGYRGIKGLHWSGYDRIMTWLTPKSGKAMPVLLEWLKPKPQPALRKNPRALPLEIPVVIEREPPLSFVAVDPMQATADTPDNVRFYSDKNSLAANREIKKPSDQPNVDGKQTLIPFTLDVPRQTLKPDPMQNPQPRPPEKQATEEKQPETKPVDLPQPQPKETVEALPKPKGGDTVGDLALAKPADRKFPSDGQADDAKGTADQLKDKSAEQPQKSTRPRTLAEARARMQANAIAGQKMQQEGGVNRQLEFSALDAKATPFGAYDAAIVAAVQQCWYGLLDQCKYSGDRRGKVVLEFRLHANGRISNMQTTENTVGDFLASLCQLAVTKPSPYARWPAEMQRLFGDVREVRFTFFY